MAEENIETVLVTRQDVLRLHALNSMIARQFQDVEHVVEDGDEGAKGLARFIPSPETQHHYPEDSQAGNEWMGDSNRSR